MNQMNFDECYDNVNVSLVDSLPITLSKHPCTAKVASQIARVIVIISGGVPLSWCKTSFDS